MAYQISFNYEQPVSKLTTAVFFLDGWADMGVDIPNQTVAGHLDGLALDHHLLHAPGVVHLVPADAELARPLEESCQTRHSLTCL